MKITFDYYEVLEAMQFMLKEKLDMDIDLEDMSPHDYPSVEYRVPVYTYKKHKNGKEVKDEHGFRVIDSGATKYETKWIDFDDMVDIHFYVRKD